MATPVREIVLAPDGALHSWDGTTLSDRLDAKQLGSLVFVQGYANRGTRIAQIPEAAAQFGIAPANDTIAPDALTNTNPSRDPNDPYGYGTGPETSAVQNAKQSYDPNAANYVAPTKYNIADPTAAPAERSTQGQASQPVANQGGVVQAAAVPNSNLKTVSDAPAPAANGTVTVHRGSEPPIIVSQQAWNDVYSKYGYVQDTPAATTPTPAPTPTTPTPTTTPIQTGQSLLLGPTLFKQLTSQGLTEADIERRGNDIYLKPTSKFYAANSGQQPTSPTTTTPTTPTSSSGGMTSPGGPSGTQNVVNPSDKAWIDSYYQKYFDRTATSSELANWAKETPQALEQFLAGDAKKLGYTSKFFQDTNNKSLQDALSVIDSSTLPPAIKDLWKTVVKGYPQGMEYNTAEILKTFQTIKDQTIDPHFRELTNIAMNDFKTQLDNLQTNRSQEEEAQRANAGDNIRQAKEGLEKSGLTFSGKGIEQLGKDSAYQQPGQANGSQLPDQMPFGGLFYEGKVNQANRLMATSSKSRFDQAQQALGAAAEQKLGTSGAAGLGITYNPTGGVTGDITTQQQAQYGSSLNQIIDNYNKKQTLNTNVNPS